MSKKGFFAGLAALGVGAVLGGLAVKYKDNIKTVAVDASKKAIDLKDKAAEKINVFTKNFAETAEDYVEIVQATDEVIAETMDPEVEIF